MSRVLFCTTQDTLNLFFRIFFSHPLLLVFFLLLLFLWFFSFVSQKMHPHQPLFFPLTGASSLLHQLKSRPLFKKLSHKLNSTHAHLTHHGSSTYTVHVESEEIIIVSLVLIFWMVFIIIFIKKWGRIRHLEPCSFVPMNGSARCGSTDHASSKNHLSLEHRLSYHGHSYHNNLNACANSVIGNPRKGSFNPLAINPKLISAIGSPNERHLSVPNCNLSARCRSVSPGGQVSSLVSSPSALWKRPLTITGHSGTSGLSLTGQTSVFDHSPVSASGWNQLTPFRVNSLPNDRRNRTKGTREAKEKTNDQMEAREGRMLSDPRQMRELEQEQKNNNSFFSSSDSTNESLEQNYSEGKREEEKKNKETENEPLIVKCTKIQGGKNEWKETHFHHHSS